MDEKLLRGLLIETLHGLVAILSDRGVTFSVPADQELTTMSLHDLQQVVKMIRDLSRTPTA